MKNISNVVAVFVFSFSVHASGPIDRDELKQVKKTKITADEDKSKLQEAAGLLADYEIGLKRLLELMNVDQHSKEINEQIYTQSKQLIDLSEGVIDSALFRLPQCADYLTQTMRVKNKLHKISHEELEQGYHLDHALPEAPEECYHTKDLFIHPATVLVLHRDDPKLKQETKDKMRLEINEVLAHTELVRELVFY